MNLVDVEKRSFRENTKPETFRLGHRPALDGLRAIFVLVVMGMHAPVHPPILLGGLLGVDGFFVLSGFLITSLLLEEWCDAGSISFRKFYARRALRLLPALIVLVLFCVVLSQTKWAASWNTSAFHKSLIPVLFYHMNWHLMRSPIPTILNHAWSLSLEEQFYILWPLILFCLLKFVRSRSWILFLVSLGIFASASLRFYFAAWERTYLGLDTRADALLTGCLIALLASWNLLPKTRIARTMIRVVAVSSSIVLVYLLANMAPRSEFLIFGGFSLVAFAYGSIIVMVLAAPIPFFSLALENPALVWIGRISYGLYLWHVPLSGWIEEWIRTSTSNVLCLWLVLTFGAAALSFYLIERPFLLWKSKFQSVGLTAKNGDEKRSRRIDWNFLAAAGLLLLFLLPILDTGYISDDILHSILRGRMALNQYSVLDIILDAILLLWDYQGRVAVLNPILFTLIFAAFPSLILYKLYLVAMTLWNVILLRKFLLQLGTSLEFAALACASLVLFFQFRLYHDCMTTFYGLLQLTLSFTLLSLIYLRRYLTDANRKYYLWSILFYFAALQSYEISFLFFVLHVLLLACVTKSVSLTLRKAFPYLAE